MPITLLGCTSKNAAGRMREGMNPLYLVLLGPPEHTRPSLGLPGQHGQWRMAARPVKGHQDSWGWRRGHELICSPRRRQKGDFTVLCDCLWDGAENVEPPQRCGVRMRVPLVPEPIQRPSVIPPWPWPSPMTLWAWRELREVFISTVRQKIAFFFVLGSCSTGCKHQATQRVHQHKF